MTGATNTQRVRLTVEYDMEVFEDDPQDMYVLCAEEVEQIRTWGFDSNIPESASINIVPILEVGS